MTPELAFELLNPISAGMPFNNLLGMSLSAVRPDGVTLEVPQRPELANNPMNGTLHGGVMSSVLDTVGGLSALAAMMFDQDLTTMEAVLERFMSFGTIDLRIDYLRPGRGEVFSGSGTVMRAGRRIAVTRMEFTNEDDVLLATGTGTYLTG